MSIVALKVLLGTLFFVFTCLAFVIMLHVLGASRGTQDRRLSIVHKSSGGLAVVLFAVVAAICIVVDIHGNGDLSPLGALHFVFAVLFIPFLVLKVLIVEKYAELRNRLLPVGTILFALAFLVFSTSAGIHMVRAVGRPAGVNLVETAKDLSYDKELFAVKCSKCHRLDRALSAKKTPEEWLQVVNAMRQKDPTWISAEEAERITRFLASFER